MRTVVGVLLMIAGAVSYVVLAICAMVVGAVALAILVAAAFAAFLLTAPVTLFVAAVRWLARLAK